MKIKTTLFDKKPNYNMGLLASTLGISPSQVCRVRQGKRNVTASFIAGALNGFPEYKFEDLFYIVKG